VDLHQYDTIILEASRLLFEGSKSSSSLLSNDFIRRLNYRLDALSDWVQSGHTLIVVLDSVWSAQYKPSPSANAFWHLNSRAPFSEVTYEIASGTRLEFCGPKHLEQFFAPSLAKLSYNYVIADADLIPLLRVQRPLAGPERAVAGVKPLGRGRVFFLPKSSVGPSYIHTAIALAAVEDAPAAELPQWVTSIRTKEEAAAVAEVAALRSRLTEIASAIEEMQSEADKLASVKALVAASGRPFEVAVATALRELGLSVVDGPNSRADLIATDGTNLLAVEAKGLDGPVREQNVTQANRWLAELNATVTASEEERKRDQELARYADQIRTLGIDPAPSTICRGLICVATFRNTPLGARSEPDIPYNVATLLSRPQNSQIAAITGLELMLSVLAIRNDSSLRDPFVSSLFSHSGAIESGLHWSDFLKQEA